MGIARWFFYQTRETLQGRLERRGTRISEAEITHLEEDFLLRIYALHRRAMPSLRAYFAARGGWVLHVDGTLSEGSPVIFVARDGRTGIVLDATVIESERSERIAPFLRGLEKAFGRPLGVVSDMGEGIRKAVNEVWPNLPHQLCHFHWLRDVLTDAQGPLYERLRSRVIALRVLSSLENLRPGADGDWQGEREPWCPVVGLVEARLLRILQEYVEAPRQGASGYPFEVPYLEVWERACRARERTHAVRMWNVRRKVSLGSLEEADDLLRRIAEDSELRVWGSRLRVVRGWLERVEEALAVGRDPTGREGRGVTLAEEGRRKTEEVVARIESEIGTYDDEEVRRWGLEIPKAWEKRREHLFVEMRDRWGTPVAIERTNWVCEQGHRWIRHRTGNGRTAMEMTVCGGLVAVVSNWINEDYVVGTGWEGRDLVREMGTVTEEEKAEGRKLKGRVRPPVEIPRDEDRKAMLDEGFRLIMEWGPGSEEKAQEWMKRVKPLQGKP